MTWYFIPTKALAILFYCCFAVSLSATEQPRPESKISKLIMGLYYPSINDMVDRKDIEISLRFWLQELTKKKGLDVSDVRLYDSIYALRDDFSKQEIDLFVAPPLAIVKHFDMQLLATGFYSIRENGKKNALLLLARSEQISELQQIRGKRLVIPYGDELAEVFLETITLKAFKENYQQLFSEINHSRKMKRMILDLFFDRADVALVYQSAYEVMLELNPQISNRIKVLQRYPIQGKNFSFFHRDYPLKDWMVNEAVLLSTYPRGRQILDIYQTAEIGICTKDSLTTFANLYQQYLDLKRDVRH
jgi:hypothetical protein